MPGLVMNVRKAQVSLEIVVIGGSIAGLASAYALRRGGHKVVVLERTDGRARVCLQFISRLGHVDSTLSTRVVEA